MKKIFLVLTAVMALAGTAWLSAGTLGNASITTEVYSVHFTDVDAGQHVPAQFLSSEENLQELPCVGTGQPGFVTCQFPEEYTGQQVPVQLTKNGIMFVYIVEIPAQ